MRRITIPAALLAVAAAVLLIAGQDRPVASRSYVGHENDGDSQAFVRTYPGAAGTRLDDCQTCHRGGPSGSDAGREFSPCSYCHLLVYPNPRYETGVPKTYEDTLNLFGLAYKMAGRGTGGLAAVETLDSDGDGASNAAEIEALRHPGDAASRPGQALAPAVRLTWEDLGRLPRREQFLLMNTTKEPADDYVTFTGVALKDVLEAAGVDLAGAEGVTVFAPDGYSVDVTIDDVLGTFPQGHFYAGPRSFAGTDRGFVKYPETLPPGIADGNPIPGAPRLMLAFARDGAPLEPSSYETGSGRLAGEGPYRLIKPQRDPLGDPARPGRPDRSLKQGAFGDGWDFNPAIDHNAGACVRGACVLRVNPMPSGAEEYDWKNGWPLVADRAVVIYGHGVKASR